jgi:hypothetical protein
MRPELALAAGLLMATGAFAQSAPTAEELRACEQAREASASGDPVMEATYANCLVIGALHETDARAHARDLARASMRQGSAIGAFALYAAYTADPAYSFRSSGKPDMAKYAALAALPIESRPEQIEALEALGFAYSKGYPKAMLSLAAYYYETVAPKNVIRVRNVAALMQSGGLRSTYIDQFRKLGAEIAALGDTKASVRVFMDAQIPARFTATATLASGGAACDQLKLVKVESGELQDPVFLPLKAAALHDTYLIKGSWDETWRYKGCGREADVTVHFSADGWGGANFRTTIAPHKP